MKYDVVLYEDSGVCQAQVQNNLHELQFHFTHTVTLIMQ